MSVLNNLNDEYTLFTSSFANLIASDAPPTTDDGFEKPTASICMAGTWRYSDLSVTDLNQVSIEYLTFGPRYQFSYHDAFGPAPVLLKSCARHQPYRGGQFFAILRLVLHVHEEAELDRSLVFRQGLY